MRQKDHALSLNVRNKLISFQQGYADLPGISTGPNLACLIAQIVDSVRRIKYVQVIKEKNFSALFSDPHYEYFDPVKAASYHIKNGTVNEAFWLIFLFTHFGKNKRTGWSLLKAVYAGEDTVPWTWNRICNDFVGFRKWLDENYDYIKNIGKFGNHRKYQSLDAYSPVGTGNAIGSYIEWVGSECSHEMLINRIISDVGNNPFALFDYLYRSLQQVISFGRTAKFDYLTMVGKLQLAPIVPGATYMVGATGPRRGAKLLFGGNVTAAIPDGRLNDLLASLEQHLNLYFGFQVLEDALCNWQKSPGDYQYFGG